MSSMEIQNVDCVWPVLHSSSFHEEPAATQFVVLPLVRHNLFAQDFLHLVLCLLLRGLGVPHESFY